MGVFIPSPFLAGKLPACLLPDVLAGLILMLPTPRFNILQWLFFLLFLLLV